MTLRRCDSLPSKLRETPVTCPDATQPPTTKISDSNTDPNIKAAAREEIIATWKSLHTDVKNIKNGFPAKNGPACGRDNGKAITYGYRPAVGRNNREIHKKITYGNRHVSIGAQDADRSSSFPLDVGQRVSDRKSSSLRRRTPILQSN